MYIASCVAWSHTISKLGERSGGTKINRALKEGSPRHKELNIAVSIYEYRKDVQQIMMAEVDASKILKKCTESMI